MSDSNGSASSGGIGLSGVLFVVFLVLKLIGVINWSWWWVTAPLWIQFLLIVVVAFLAAIISAVLSR